MSGKNSRRRTATRHILVTGYPGFLGKRLVRHLLEREPSARLYLLVQQKFLDDARAYIRSVSSPAAGKVKLMVGDIAALHLGLSGDDIRLLQDCLTDVYHLAAISYLKVSDRYMWQVNVQGTNNLLELAGSMRRLRRFNYMSTCYVSGNHGGVFMEDELDEGQGFRNHYERTKFEAEKLVRRAAASLPVSIYRPSVVVGDSRTGEIGRFDGPYTLGMLLAVSAERVPLPLPGRGLAPVHLVPVDYVTEALYRLSLDERAVGLTFHLVDPNPLPARRLYRLVAERLGKKTLPVGFSAALVRLLLKFPGLEKLSRTHRQALDYLSDMVIYHHGNTDRLLGDSDLRCPPVESYLDRLIEFVRRTVSASSPEQDTDPLE
jgi:thioester reductase-like protein